MRPALALLLALGLILAPPPSAARISLLGLKNSLVQFLLRQVSVEGSFEIAAEGVEEPRDGVTELVGVTVADAEGVWLRVEGVALSWNAGRILRGELEIGELSARGLEVLRRPTSAPEVEVNPDSELGAARFDPFAWPRLPITTRVERLALDGAVLAPGVLGADGLAFDAEGAFRDEGPEQALRLVVTRTDAVAGSIRLDYARRFDAETLDLSLAAEEAAGGLVAGLAGLPADSASRVTVQARGPLRDWALDLSAVVERMIAVEGAARIDAAAPIAVEARLTARPGAALDPAVAAALGAEARFDLAFREGADGVVAVETARIASPALEAAASGAWVRATGRMDFDLDLAALAPLAAAIPGAAFERIGFDGRLEGVPDAFAAEGRIAVAGLATAPADLASGRFEARVTRAGETISLAAEGLAEGLRLDRLAPDLLGAPALSIDAAWSLAENRGRLTTFALASPALTLAASGEVDLAGETAALAYEAAAPDLAPLAAAYGAEAGGAFAAEGRAEGPLAGPRLTGRAVLERITLGAEAWGGVALTHDVTLDLAAEAGPGAAGTVALTAEGSPLGPAAAEARFALAGERLELTSLTAEALSARLDGALTADLGGPTAEGRVTLTAPDLAPLSDLAGTPLAGAAEATVTLSAPGGRQDARIEARAEALAAPEVAEGAALARLTLDAALTDLLGAPAARFEAAAEGAEAAGARLGRLTLAGTATDLTGAPTLEATAEAAELTAGEARVASLTAEVSARDLIAAPSASFSAVAEALSAGDATVARVTLSGEAADLAGAGTLAATAEATGLAAGAARIAAITAEVDARDLTGAPAATFAARARELSAGDARLARLSLTGEATDLTGAPTLDLKAEAADLAAGDATLAALTAEGAFRDLLAAPEGRLTAEGTGLAAGPLRARVLRFEGEGRDLLAAPAGEARLALRGLRSTEDDWRMTVLALEAGGRAEALTLALSGRGETAGAEPIRLEGAAAGALAGEDAEFTVSTLRLRAGETRAGLRAPLTLRRAGGVTRAEGLDLGLPGGGLRGAAALHPDGLVADLALAFADLAPLAALLGAPLEAGALQATATLDTRPATADGRLDLAATGLVFAGALDEARDLAAEAGARWDGRRLEATGALAGGFGAPATFEAAFPLLPAGLLPAPPADARLEARLGWAGEIGEIWALVPAPDHVLSGRLDLDLRLEGPLRDPSPAGRIALSGGAYQNLETGTILTDLTAASRLLPGGGLALSLAARDGAEGPVAAEVALEGAQIEATLTTREAVLVRRDDVVAAVTADIRAAGPLTAPVVSGDVLIDRAELRLVATGAPNLPDLGEIEIKGAPPAEAEAGVGEGGPTLDLTVRAPGNLFVRGRGLNSEWSMDLRVAGRVAAPRITGEIAKRRGTFSFIGREFELVRGRIAFGGRDPIDPALDVALEHERTDILGRIAVRGFASDPRVAFESVPALPEDEVLPRVLFGRARQSLSPSQAIQLAGGVATLLSGREGLLGGARAAAGLDVLSVDLGDEGEAASVRAGRNLADGVYVGVRQPLDGSAAAVQVEVEVFDNVTVDGETDGEGSSVGLNWRFDY